MRKHLRQDSGRRLYEKLLDLGATVSASGRWLTADLAGRCQTPVRVSMQSRANTPERKFVVIAKRKGNLPFLFDIDVPCRKCPACMKNRAAHWRYRMVSEYKAAPRSWLCSFTYRPDVHQYVLNWLRAEHDAAGDQFDALPIEKQFQLRAGRLAKYATLYFKRLRKEGNQFRYVLVAEAHASGLPHHHALIHEVADPVRHASLARAWEWGFMNAKLIHEPAQAAYVAKYLSKSMGAKLRASIDYGSPPTVSNDKRQSFSLPLCKNESPPTTNNVDGACTNER